MTWHEYVSFTSTTALPVASDPDYLRLGVLEEAYEALEAYSAYCAAFHGRQKRILRGDAPKDDAMVIAKRRLVEELGDLAWYVARLHFVQRKDFDYLEAPTPTLGGIWCMAHAFHSLQTSFDYVKASHDMLCYVLGMAGEPIETVLGANIAKLTSRKSAGTIQGEGER